MIKLITGEKGTGKTKIIIDMMNEAVKSTNGNLVCIEKGVIQNTSRLKALMHFTVL